MAEIRNHECVYENCKKTITTTRKDVKHCCGACKKEADCQWQEEHNAAKKTVYGNRIAA